MPEIMFKIKVEIERFLRNKFIRPSRYVKWLANIVLIIRKDCTLIICIGFRDINIETSKDEYQMLVDEMMVDYAAGFEYLSLLNGYFGYN